MEVDPTRMCELLIGLPAINVVGIDDERDDVVVHIEARAERPGCAACGTAAWVKDHPTVELVDLPCFGRPARLVWHKQRWCCPDVDCEGGGGDGPRYVSGPVRVTGSDPYALDGNGDGIGCE